MKGPERTTAEPEELLNACVRSEGHLAQEHRLATGGTSEGVGVQSEAPLGPAQQGVRRLGGARVRGCVLVGPVLAQSAACQLLVAALPARGEQAAVADHLEVLRGCGARGGR